MAKKVAIDIGHGSNTFPANGKGVRRNGVGYAEHNFNSKLAIKTKALLENSGIKVVMIQQPYSPDISLVARTNWYRQQGLDAIVSQHANAGVPSASGRCAFYWHTATRARNLAQALIDEIKKKGYTTHGNGLHASLVGSWTNLHMARVPALWSNPVPSVLVEYGFMTSSRDFPLIFGNQQEKYTNDMAEATARGMCRFLGVTYKGKNVTSPNAPVTVSPSNSETHTVKAGDTLWAIGQANGVSVEELKRLNNLKNNIINVGQKLIVKVKADKKDEVILTRPETYTIKSGDTLGEIATEFGVKMSDLVSWNNIKNPNLIVVGDTLRIQRNATIPTQTPTSNAPRFVVGERVRISPNAKTYATNETIPTRIRGNTYTIMQVRSDRVLLQEIMSWVRRSDIVGSTSTSTPKPAPKPAQSSALKSGDKVRINNSARTYQTGENIPSSVKGKTYTIMQVGSGRVLLREIMSWVRTGDVSRVSGSTPAPAPKARTFRVNDKVKIKSSASKYVTNQNIPSSVKNKTYTIMQIRNNGKEALLREIMSWVYTKDLQ